MYDKLNVIYETVFIRIEVVRPNFQGVPLFKTSRDQYIIGMAVQQEI